MTQLYHSDGRAVQPGDEVISFRGEKFVVTGWPKTGRNRVWVRSSDSAYEHEFFPSVFNLSWEP